MPFRVYIVAGCVCNVNRCGLGISRYKTVHIMFNFSYLLQTFHGEARAVKPCVC